MNSKGSGTFKVREDAGELIRERRRAAGLSQASLGVMVGTTQAAISQLEGGQASMELAMNCANVLGMDVHAVIEWVPRK